MARDITNIYGDDKDISRVFDYFQQKQGISASLRQFIMDFSFEAKNIIASTPSPTIVSNFCSQKSLSIQALTGTFISAEEQNNQILFVESYSILYEVFSTREISATIGGLTGEVADRGCSGEGFITAVTISAITALIFAKQIDIALQGSTVLGHGAGFYIAAGTLIGIVAVATVVAIAVWAVNCGVGALINWMFPHLFDGADCTLPNDFFVSYTDCGAYRVTLLNGGSSIVNTTWLHVDNTGFPIGSTSLTVNQSAFSSPVLIPSNPSQNVIIKSMLHTCDGNTLTNDLLVVFLPTAVNNFFPPVVAFPNPTTTTTYNTVVQYWVTVSSSYNFNNLSWSFPDGGGSIVEQGSTWVKVKFWLTGERKIRATLTNTCSGLSGSAEVKVQVNP